MEKGWLQVIFESLRSENRPWDDADSRGSSGEKLTVNKLDWLRLFGRDGYILTNLYVPIEIGKTTEIDLVFLTRKGVFVIESKNYSGWIFGDEKSWYWTACLPKSKNKFYNPIKQNDIHIESLVNYLEDARIPIFSLIVFSERCEIKKMSVESSGVYVIKRNELNTTIKNIWKERGDWLGEAQLEDLHQKLKPLTDVDWATKTAHLLNMQEKYGKKKAPKVEAAKKVQGDKNVIAGQTESQLAAESLEICPRCGGRLVLRTAKKGQHMGSQFYGCSNFPKCRFMRKNAE